MDSYQPIRDDDGWIREGFLIPKGKMSSEDYRYRQLEDGLFSVSNTTLGGSQAVNAPPQFTELADINVRRFADDDAKQYEFVNADGIGDMYHSRIERNSIYLHMRFGVPVHSTFTRFFGNFYNPDAASLVNRGRTSGLARNIGRIIGSVAALRVLPYIMLGQMFKFLIDKPTTKYYYLKPTMYAYHEARNNMLNSIMADLGMVQGMGNSERPEGLDQPDNQDDLNTYNRILPGIYNSNGSVDFFAVGTRYQRLMNQRYRKLQKATDGARTSEELLRKASEIYRKEGFGRIPPKFESLNDYLSKYTTTPDGQVEIEAPTETPNNESSEEGFASSLWSGAKNLYQGAKESVHSAGNAVSDFVSGDDEVEENTLDAALKSANASAKTDSWDSYITQGEKDPSIFDLKEAEMNDGSQFITFKIEPPSLSESFQNQVENSGIENAINGMSSTARNLRFNLMDGKMDDGILASTIGAATSAVTNLLGGMLDSVGISGIAALAGNAHADIPKHWTGSTAQLPKINATMKLRAWAKNDLCRLQNIYYPLASIFAGAVPRSTGHSSWGRPLLCEYYCKGYGQSRLAIVDSLTIKRAPGDHGITRDGKLLAVDIDFSLLDLSTVMHMTIASGFNLTDLTSPAMAYSKYMFSDPSTYGDYVSTLAGLGMVDQVYTTRRIRKNWHKFSLNFQQWSSTSHWVSYYSNSGFLFGASPGRWLSSIADVTDRG